MCPRENGPPPTVRPEESVRSRLRYPRRSASSCTARADPSRRCSAKISRTTAASSSRIFSMRPSDVKPNGTRPPIHMPLALEAAILSRIRSAVTSRSNCAKLSSTLSVRRPMLVAVLKDWVTETKDAPAPSSRSTSLAKSASERVSRSIL